MDGRKTQVVLLDERKIELVVQSRMVTQDLLHIVCNYFSLTEKAYFGLSFQDDSGHYFFLQNDCKVLDHEYPAKHRTGVLILYFLVKLYPEHISHLQDSVTYELFFLQTRSLIFRGFINVDGDVAYKLAALALQASYGDFYDDDLTKENLKKLPVLPRSVFREHPTLSYSEERVICEHKQLIGRLRGSCIIEYLQIAQALPTYGVHFYHVKDNKTNAQATLGLSATGVSQYAVSNYDAAGKKERVKFFGWKQLENLYYREKKFSIEVRDPRRIMQTLSSFNLQDENDAAKFDKNELPLMTGNAGENDDILLTDAITDPTTHVSLSRRTYGPTSVTVHSWFTSHPLLTKNLWQMAIIQHQFFLECKHRRQQLLQHQQAPNNLVHQDLAVIAARLNTVQAGALPPATTLSSDSNRLHAANAGSTPKNRLSHNSFFRSSSILKPSTSHTSLNTSTNSNASGTVQPQPQQPMISRSYSTTTTRRRSAVLEAELSKQQHNQQPNVDTISINSSPLMLHRRSHTVSSKDQLDGGSSSNNDSNLLFSTAAVPVVTELNSSHSTGEAVGACGGSVDGSFRDRIEILRTRRMALDDAVNAKIGALKALCVREAELTGILPDDTPMVPGEALPSFKKRMGTAFNLSGSKLERFMSSSSVNAAQNSNRKGVDTVDSGNNHSTDVSLEAAVQNDADDAVEKQLAELELRQELQRQIVHAVQVLANDATVTSKKIRKQRKHTLATEQQKSVEIDRQLSELKKSFQQPSNGVIWTNQTASTSSNQQTSSRIPGRRLFSQLRQQQQSTANIRNAGAQPLIVSRLAAGSSSSTSINTTTRSTSKNAAVFSADMESVMLAKPAGSSILRQNSLQITTTTASIHPAAVTTTLKGPAAVVDPDDVQSIGCTSSIVDTSSSSSSAPSSVAGGSLMSLSITPNIPQRIAAGGGATLRTNLLIRRASKLSVDSSGTNSLLMPPPPPPPLSGPKTSSNSAAGTQSTAQHDAAAHLLRKSQSQGALHTITTVPNQQQHADMARQTRHNVTKQHSAQTLPTAHEMSTLADMSVSGGNIATASTGAGRGCAENDSGFVADASCCAVSTLHAKPKHSSNDYDEIEGENLPASNEVDVVDEPTQRQHVYNVQKTRPYHHHHTRHLSKVSELAEQQPSSSTGTVQKSINVESNRPHNAIYDEVEELNRSKYDNVDSAFLSDSDANEPGTGFVRSSGAAVRPDGELYEQTRASMRVLSSSSTNTTSTAAGNMPTTVTTTAATSASTATNTTRAVPVDIDNDDDVVSEKQQPIADKIEPESASIQNLTSVARSNFAAPTNGAGVLDDVLRRRMNLFRNADNLPTSSSSRITNPALSASAHKRRPLALRSDAVSSFLDADTAQTILNAVGMTASPTHQASSNSGGLSDSNTLRTFPSSSADEIAHKTDQHRFAVPQIPPPADTRRTKPFQAASGFHDDGSYTVQQRYAPRNTVAHNSTANYQSRIPSAAPPTIAASNHSSESRWYYNQHYQQQQQQAASSVQPNKSRHYQFGMQSSAAPNYHAHAAGLPPRASQADIQQQPQQQQKTMMQYAYGESISGAGKSPPTGAGANQQLSPIGYPQRFHPLPTAAEQLQQSTKIAASTTPYSPLPPQPLNSRIAPVASAAAGKVDLNKTMRAAPPPSPTNNKNEPVRFPSGTASNNNKTGANNNNTKTQPSATSAADNPNMPSSSPQPPPLPSKRERCRSNSNSNNTLIRAVGSSAVVVPPTSTTRAASKMQQQQDNSRTTRSAWNGVGDALASDDKYVRQALV